MRWTAVCWRRRCGVHEDALGFAVNEPAADERARTAGGTFEHRLVVRAEALAVAQPLGDALRHLRAGSRLAVGAGVVLAAIAGAAATQAVFGTSTAKPVNFFWVLGTLLGVHTLALLAWLVLMIFTPRTATGGALGAAVTAAGRRINRWLHKGPMQAAAARAAAAVFARGAIGRWTLGTLTHVLWLAFLAGCLAMVLLTLSAKQYSFAWETTILTERNYMALAGAIGALPAALGFPVPDPEQVAASRWTGTGAPAAETREAWAGLLVGAIVVYGVFPRAVVLLLSVAARAFALGRYRLDTTQPGFARLQARLVPPARATGVVDADGGGIDTAEAGALSLEAPPPIAPDGPAAILGLEIVEPKTGWPPRVDGVRWMDLGFVDDRAERHRVTNRVITAAPPPRATMVVCSLAATPDRGTGAFVRTLQQTSHIAVIVVLSDGERLRRRGHPEHVAQRIDDWRRLAAGAGVPDDRVIEVDLDHLTDASRGRLAELIGGGIGSAAATPARRLDDAFDLIVDHVRRWSGQPDVAQQAELQRKIARLYQGREGSWVKNINLDINALDADTQIKDLKSGADRMVRLLPARLRLDPRWLSAGALAGALGCVAAATVVSPVAIAALPAWAGLGAAVSALIGPSGSGDAPSEDTAIDLTQAVMGAALFAAVLHLQGRDETAITRVIDRMAGEDDPPPIRGVDEARAWLRTLRDRFHLAMAGEGAS